MKNTYLVIALAALLILGGCRKSEDYVAKKSTVDAGNTIATVDDSDIPKVCIEKVPSGSKPNGVVMDAVELAAKKWPNGQVLRIKFLNGTTFLQAKVMQFARAWEPYANISFVQVSASSVAEIRVGFQIGGDNGSWSYVGNDALQIAANKQTVNFGWFTATTSDKEFSRVTTHEFGHAIGLVHEQSSPVEAIKWNKPVVYAYYAKAPNYWSKADVDNNIFYKYSAQVTQYTVFDPLSIMEYPVDPTFTTDHIAIGYNYYLSAIDKAFIGNIYPEKVTDIDGNVYPTVKIGKQVWMAQNLRVTHFANGAPIPYVTDKTKWTNQTGSAYCSYNNNTSLMAVYGALYNQYAISDTRSVCPKGWHIPTLAEWTTLQNYLGGKTLAGGALKETGLSHWLTPNTGAKNTSGFTALGSGWRDHLGTFSQFKTTAWWGYSGAKSTDTALPSINAASASYGVVNSSTEGKALGLPLRLIKNTDIL